MIFSIIILVLFAGVAFYHYVQGFFSAFLSLVLVAISSVVALGFHQQLAELLSQGKVADHSYGAVLAGLFAGSYVLLRLIFDRAVPGNVNFGFLADKIGAGVCGVVAALFATGTFAVMAQTLPFGPNVIGYGRWETTSQKVNYNSTPEWARNRSRSVDVSDMLYKNDELKEARLDPAKAGGMMIPADDFVIGFLNVVSAGSLSGDLRFSDRNPAYLNQLFAQRVGLQPGAKVTAFPQGDRAQFDVAAIYLVEPAGLRQVDGEIKEFRTAPVEIAGNLMPLTETQRLIIVRVTLLNDSAEADGRVRFGLANFRILTPRQAGRPARDFHPIAIRDSDGNAVLHRADDFLILPGGKGVDLIFSVETADAFGDSADLASAELKVIDGTILEFKRLSRITIGGNVVKSEGEWEASPDFNGSLFRRVGLREQQQEGK
jgi:hypothetical protein